MAAKGGRQKTAGIEAAAFEVKDTGKLLDIAMASVHDPKLLMLD